MSKADNFAKLTDVETDLFRKAIGSVIDASAEELDGFTLDLEEHDRLSDAFWKVWPEERLNVRT